MRSLPIEHASWISGALWRLFAPFSSRHRRMIAQLRAAYPDETLGERTKLAIQSWDTMGRVFAESFRLEDILNSDRVIVEDIENVRNRLSATKGFIACTAHQGNWEIAVVGFAKLGIRTAGIYRRLKNPLVNDMALAQRVPLYPDGLFPKQASTALLAAKYVKAGGALSIMADLRERGGIKVPFFGRLAPSNAFPAYLAVTLKKPVFVAHVMRDPGVRFRIRLEEIDVSTTGDRDANVLATTAAIQAALERNIRSRPGEWMWAHGRWV